MSSQDLAREAHRQDLRQYNIGRLIFEAGKRRDLCENGAQREGWDDAYQELACAAARRG